MAQPAPTPGMRPDFAPQPHQQRLAGKLRAQGSIVVAQGVGTGKTAGSIHGFDELRKTGKIHRALVVTPAGLKTNYADAVRKFSTFTTQVLSPKGDDEGVYVDKITPDKDFTIVSYEMFRRDPKGLLAATGADMLIFDEYHKVRDPGGSTYRAAAEVRPLVRSFVGLTGSAVNNDPVDLIPLINLAAGKVIMSPRDFNSRYKRRYARTRGFFGGAEYLSSMQNMGDLQKKLSPYVDYISSDELGNKMPRREVEEVNVPMSKEQQDYYNYTMKKVDPLTAWKIRNNLPVDQKEAAHVFTMIQQARQAANSIGPFVRDLPLDQAAGRSPKVKQLLDDAEQHLKATPDGQVVLYSNLIKGGVDVLTAGLKARGIEPAVFVGKGREVDGQKITADTRNQGVTDYLAGKKKVIVVSPAGAEGLDLRNTTWFASLDGHFNPERTRQAEARARRLNGLAQRPEEQRVVQVRRYMSTFPEPGFWGRLMGRKPQATTDQWVDSVARQKFHLNQQMLSAFKQKPLLAGGAPPAPTKYLRRWRSPQGDEWRYEYPKEQPM